MELREIAACCDHTLLKQEAGWAQIQALCEEGITYGCASVCIPASYVKQATDYAAGRVRICTVIGFPNGCSTTAVKVFETADAVRNGADEIDMVINLGWVKDAKWDSLLAELRAVKAACGGRVLKVIVEACLLTEAEKIRMCQLVTQAGADYIKTSTGFSTGGATLEDVALFRAHVGPDVKIKAAGGIRTIADAEAFLAQGADRLGTSAVVKQIKAEDRK